MTLSTPDDRTVAAAILDGPARADGAAFVDETGVATSYAALREAVETIAAALAAAGLGSSARIATVSPRGASGAVAFLAASSIASCCPLNPGMRRDEFAAAFASMGVTALLCGEVASAAADVARDAGLTVVFYAENGATELRATGGVEPPAENPPGAAMLMQTSGTTSAPKLVPLTHANILAAARGIVDFFALADGDLCLNPMPLHHVHGLISATLSSLLAGATVCCAKAFSPASFDAALAALEPTWFTASPAMHQAMRDFYGRAGRTAPGRRLRFFRSSSAPMPASVIADLERLFDAPLTETYGLTETASMICANPLPPAARKPGTVGIGVGTELRVVDADGVDLAAGEAGEVLVRGPSVISGYLGPGVDRGATFFGDWLRTGDVGALDSDRYLSIVGRTKELIKRGGLSVYPSEVDDALASHPGVAEAVAFSIPHPTLGEELAAAVVPAGDVAPGEDALRAHVAARLSAYKVPAVILTTTSLPKNETGKVLRRQLAARFAERLAPKNEPAADDREAGMLELWRETLGRSDFGVSDNLLLLGADPLRAARVSELAFERLKLKLSPKEMIAAPTVRAIAALAAARETVS